MRKMQVALAAVLFALATPAFAQVVQGTDGQYYKLVRLRHARAEVAPAPAAPVSEPTSSCHIVPAQTNPYCPPDCQWTTACGPM
jgi:hypothetical protein